MQKFKDIEKVLKFVEDITDNISKALNENEQNEEKINKLYQKRKEYVEQLTEFSKDNDLKDFFKNDKFNLAKRIRVITEADKKNLEKLKEISQSKGNDIKNLMNKKALLIYRD